MNKRTKFALLLLLSLLSVFFAEVISGSMKFPLLDPWGYFIVIPLYGLHTILLLVIIKRFDKGTKYMFVTLYLAGVLFGLYEAYLTKVLWTGLNDDAFILLHIAVIDFIVLVFFWHPLFSFIIPVLVFEAIATNSSDVLNGLPPKMRQFVTSKKGVLTIFVIIGLFSAFNGVTPFDLALSLLALGVPILIFIYILKTKNIMYKYSLDEILPNKLGITLSSMYLLFIYVFLALIVKFEVLTLSNQLVIFANYLVYGLLFYLQLKKTTQKEETYFTSKEVSFRQIVIHFIVILITGMTSVLVLWLLGIRDLFVIVTWISWILLGLVLIVYSIIKILKRRAN